MVGGETLCDGRESAVSRHRKNYKNPNNHGHVLQKRDAFIYSPHKVVSKRVLTSEWGKAKITNKDSKIQQIKLTPQNNKQEIIGNTKQNCTQLPSKPNTKYMN